MKNVKCVHPIKVNRIIKSFVEDFFPLCVDVELAWDNDSSINYAICADEDEVTIYIPNWKKANFKNDNGGKCFRKDFTERCPLGKGFSDITISLLHEIGHAMTNRDLPENYDRASECAKVNRIKDNSERCFAYFKMLDETLATDWAIKWLQDPEQRKIAKDFEKQFWACFE